MKKIWLPYPLYILKSFSIGLVGLIILYVSEDLFNSGFAVLCLGYAAWIIFMGIIRSIKESAMSSLGKSKGKKIKHTLQNFLIKRAVKFENS